MTFWKFCEKVSGFVGERTVLNNILNVRIAWDANKTVAEAVELIRQTA